MPKDTKKPRPLCVVCHKSLEDGAPRYRLKGGIASAHLECRDKIKPESPARLSWR
jgi:hypothetical protein